MSIASPPAPTSRAQLRVRNPRPKLLPDGFLLRFTRAAAVFAVAMFASYLIREAGLLTGYWVLGLAGLGLVLIPTARLLSRRVLLNGLILSGLLALLWWIPAWRLGTDHGTLMLGLLAGSILAWCSFGPYPLRRARLLLPKIKVIDFLPLLAGLLSAASMSTFLQVRSPAQALSVMTTRWDFQSHFSIYNMLRSQGTVIPMAPAPAAGGTWGFVEYPQAFHAVLATMADLINPVSQGLDAELVSFFNLQAVLCGITVVLVVAGLCSLGPVRRHAVIMAPVVALMATAWVMGPGAIPIFEGFANFYVGCGIAAATILVFLSAGPKLPVVAVAAMGAGVIGVSMNWILLVSLIAVTLFMALTNVLVRRNRYNMRWFCQVATIAAVTVLGVALPILQVLPLLGSAEGILAAPGGMPLPDMGWALAITLLTIALGIACLKNGVGRANIALTRRAGIVAVGLLLPVGISVWLAYSQVQGTGSISYYFYKYVVAVELVTWSVGAAALATILPTLLSNVKRRQSLAAVSASTLAVLAATQVFGFTVSGLKDIGLPSTAFPIMQSALQLESTQAVSPTVNNLLASGRLGVSKDAVYVSDGGGMNPILALRWQLGMSGNLTSKNMGVEVLLADISVDSIDKAERIAAILATDPELKVLVTADLYAIVQDELPDIAASGRLLRVN